MIGEEEGEEEKKEKEKEEEGQEAPYNWLTPDHPPLAAFTGSSSSSSSSSSLRELGGANERHPEDRRVRKRLGSRPA